MSFTSFMIRRNFGKGDRKRDEGLQTPSDIRRYDNILYGPNKKWHKLDVYRPKNTDEKLPVIISVHGGAWMYGDKDVYQWYCMNLAQRGFAVVNFTYRLAPEYKFPAGIEDTNRVFEWVRDNANTYSFDLENIFAVGDSAGAHMLSVYSSIKTNTEYATKFDFAVADEPKIKAVALNCGMYDMQSVWNSDDKQHIKLMRDILPNKGKEYSEFVWISSLQTVTSAFPPAFVMTAEGDFLKEQAKPMADKLMEAGVPCKFKLYGDEKNPLGHVFHCNIKLEDARICNDDECDFFRRYM